MNESIDFGNINMDSFDTSFMMNQGTIEAFGTLGIIINILGIILYFFGAYGLYLINTKLGEKHAWLSFVPLINIYNYFTASKKPVKEYLVYPILAVIVGIALSVFTFGLSAIIAIIYFLVMWIKLLHAISLRTGRGAWTTVGLLFINAIMLFVVGIKMKDTNIGENNMTESENPVLTNKSENEIEL